MDTNEFPTLYAVDSKGKVKIWSLIVLHNPIDLTAIIRKVYGRDGEKMQVNDKTISKGKNIGKSNETTAYEQAISEANSNWKKQIDKGYSETKPEPGSSNGLLRPMLAQNFKNRSHNIEYPAACQPKLNGIRCLAEKVSDTVMKYHSKNGKSLDTFLGHLTPHLLEIMYEGEVFDGELYKHDWSFQKIASHSKRLQPTSSQLEFWVFDIADTALPFVERFHTLTDRITGDSVIKLVEWDYLKAEEAVKHFHDIYVAEGYEGAIIRNMDGMYRLGYRSAEIQKYKEFEDKEFVIVGGHEGDGQEEGCVIFDCLLEDGVNTVAVRPKGSREKRRRWWKELDSLIGKKLTVRFQERSEKGVPIFPVGIAIRDYE